MKSRHSSRAELAFWPRFLGTTHLFSITFEVSLLPKRFHPHDEFRHGYSKVHFPIPLLKNDVHACLAFRNLMCEIVAVSGTK